MHLPSVFKNKKKRGSSLKKTLTTTDGKEVTLIRKKGCRQITLSVRPLGKIVITAPSIYPELFIKEFLTSKEGWIIESLKKSHISVHPYQSFINQPKNITFKKKLILKSRDGDSILTYKSENAITIYVPRETSFTDSSVLPHIHKEVISEMKKEGKDFLPKRVTELAEKHSFYFNQITVKDIKSRWGSCSSLGNINLNCQLMRLSLEQIDYIILHELCHTKHMNHQKEFHQLLESLLPNAREIERSLKKERIFKI